MTTDTQPILLGAHTSASGGVQNALLEGERIGATTIQLFTSNQKQWKGRTLTDEMIEKWEMAREGSGIQKVMSHDSYLINLGSPKEEVLAKSKVAFQEELSRCHQLKIDYMNFHPGAALKEDRQLCLDKIILSLLESEELAAKGSTRLLLETTAGQGSTVGCKFEELRYIIDGVKERIPIGVCVDTCHIFAAGYDLATTEACEATLKEFEEVIGLEHLYAFHLNDSLKECGSRVDRHQPLGKGCIGIDCFRFLMTDPRTKYLPKYLETPGGEPLWKEEIAMLRSMVEGA